MKILAVLITFLALTVSAFACGGAHCGCGCDHDHDDKDDVMMDEGM